MSYIHLPSAKYTQGNYSVVSYRQEDLVLIKNWRNEQMDVLRQNRVLTDEDQRGYYERYIVPSFTDRTTKIMLFSLLHDGICIGYGGLTNIHWTDSHVELSFLVDPVRAADAATYTDDFTHFLELMKHIAFEELGFNRIFTETYDIRPLHVRILEQSGFKLEGRMREHVRINGIFTDSLIHGFIKQDYEIGR